MGHLELRTTTCQVFFVKSGDLDSEGQDGRRQVRQHGHSVRQASSGNCVKVRKAELMPPSPAEIPAAIGGAANLVKSAMTFKWANLTMREAWLNTLVAVEVGCWFFIGECIGKGSLVAYKVNDTTARNTH